MAEDTPNGDARQETRYERLARKWANNYAKPRPCEHRSGRTSLFQQINSNGARYVYTGCSECGTRIGPANWISHEGLDLGEIPVTSDNRTANPPCAVCGAWGTERHHWAPRELFGDEAEHWPTAWLCTPCHAEWHKRINDSDPGRIF